MRYLWTLFFLGLFLPTQALAATAKALIEGTTPATKADGLATFKDTAEGLEIRVDVFNAPPGQHGLHIHETGSCGDAGNAAGGHYNPETVKHGLITKDGLTGAHLGDLGNIEIQPGGFGSVTVVVPYLTVKGGKYNVEGRTVVLHDKVDDFGQPTGNAGARIGCGVIEAVPGE